jgi:S-methylmethionine-dependent homocysteine/selenocysteine methylase
LNSQPRWARIEASLAGGECIILDGGVGSEIARAASGASETGEAQPEPWSIYDRTERVLEVHRQYALAGCDVISTNTWGILGSTATVRGRRPGRTGLPAWTVATRDAVSLARRGIAEASRTGQCAVAFSLNDADPLLAGEQLLLGMLWSVDPPDLVLVETLTAPPGPALSRAIGEVAASGMPVWVSFCPSGLRGLPGTAVATPGEPSGWLSRAVAELEQAGVQAVLVNCIPLEHTSTALAELAASTSLPVGCYPRLEGELDPASYGELSVGWRAEGARIVGGCCGVGPAHISAVRDRLAQRAETRS